MSSSMALRRSPKPGALTAATLSVPRSLLTTRVAKRFAFDFFREDDERLAHLGDLLEDRQQVLHAADLLLIDEDERLFHDGFHPLGVGDEVGGDVAAIELHALDHVQRGGHGLGFLDRDDAVLADLLHRFRDQIADGLVVVG